MHWLRETIFPEIDAFDCPKTDEQKLFKKLFFKLIQLACTMKKSEI